MCRIFKTPTHGVFFIIHNDQIFYQKIIMTLQEMYQEMEEQLMEDCLLGYNDQSFYDDGSVVSLEIDFTTQS